MATESVNAGYDDYSDHSVSARPQGRSDQPLPPSSRTGLLLRRGEGTGHRRLLDYNCGEVSEAELLKTADASRYGQCEEHFIIGMRKLAESDRSAAQEHFRASVATGVFFYFGFARWEIGSRLKTF